MHIICPPAPVWLSGLNAASQGSRTGVRGRVQVSRLSAFLGERSLADVIAWSDPGIYSPREVVDRALSRLGKSKYWALTNNCEHCTFLVTDRQTGGGGGGRSGDATRPAPTLYLSWGPAMAGPEPSGHWVLFPMNAHS
ncbi:hypothetical protein I4F81_009596 [Pyropia yezoensis]|uniref:Uncharacterized protein n=1 Tax=Pyropia yezoensis TaxID=2788 RepID=A0ACC3CBB6_PYRYE|nr:hypothetical protein I4F81_009596 [Neopyropia yezoensis]